MDRFSYHRLIIGLLLSFCWLFVKSQDEGLWHFDQGDSLYSAGKYELSIEQYQKASTIYKATEDWNQYAKCLTSEANSLSQLSQFRKASPIYEQAFIIAKEKVSPISEAAREAMDGLGFYHSKIGNFSQSISYYKELLTINLKLFGENHKDVADVYNSLGVLYGKLRDHENHYLYLKKALDIRRKVLGERSEHTAQSYNNLSVYYQRNRDYENQLYYIQKALDIMIEVRGENDLDVAAFYNNLGNYYGYQKKYSEQLVYYKKTLEIRKFFLGEKNISIARAYNNLGWAYGKLGEKETQAEYYKKALAIKVELLGEHSPKLFSNYYNLASIAFRKQKYDATLNYLQNATIAMCQDFNESNVNIFPEEKNFNSNSVKLFEVFDLKAKTYLSKFSMDSTTTQLELALSSYLAAGKLADKIRTEYGSDKINDLVRRKSADIYYNILTLCELLYQETKDEKYVEYAFVIAEQSKGRMLLETLNAEDAEQLAGLSKEMIEREDTLRQQKGELEKAIFDAKSIKDTNEVDRLENELFDLNREKQKHINQLKKHYPQYFKLKYGNSLVSLKQLQNTLLDNDKQLIEYLLLPERELLLILQLSSDKLQLHSIPIPNDFNLKIEQLHKALADFDFIGNNAVKAYSLFTSVSHELYQMLLEPVLNTHYTKELIISPDGAIGGIPFEILLTEKADTTKIDYTSLSYLLHDHVVSYTYSGSLLMENNQNCCAGNDLCLAFAPSSKDLSARAEGNLAELNELNTELPGSQTEVKAIATHYEGDYYFGKDATKQQFINNINDFGIIHMAMHGHMNIERPMYSKLIFSADDSVQEKDLFAYELPLLSINADLVVLSACETGSGQYIKGEGTMSLARGFMMAGVPSVVMTLWKVNDRSSAELMGYFYENLSIGLNKAEALRQAKKMFLKTANKINAHPAFWAGFVAMGDTRPISSGPGYMEWILLVSIILAIGYGAIRYFWYLREKRQSTQLSHNS